MKIDKLKVAVVLKLLISLFLTYSLLFKGNACALASHIGNYIQTSNYFIGIVLMFTTVITYFVLIRILHLDIEEKNKFSLKICYMVDALLLLLNTIGFYYVNSVLNSMPKEVVLPTVISEGGGTVVITGLMTLIIFFVVQRTADTNFITVNNPFKLVGKIGRMTYLLTEVSIIITNIIWMIIVGFGILSQQATFLATCLVLAGLLGGVITIVDLFASSKRLRDIQWHQGYLLLLPIPIVTIFAKLPLLFVKGK